MLQYLHEFIAVYGRTEGLTEYLKYREIFTSRRSSHNHNIPEVWIKTPYMLREASARPNVWEFDLKPGYFWPELVH